jgi:WD40 repeat protein
MRLSVTRNDSLCITEPRLNRHPSRYITRPSSLPLRSIIRQRFKKQIPRWICKTPKVESNWTSTLQTLEGHSDSVNAMAFSPNGKMVASASGDSTVRLWDSATGSALQTLKYDVFIDYLSFSKDGRYLDSNRGQLAIGHLFGSVTSSQSEFAKERGEEYLLTALGWSKEWENVVWLPSDFRATCAAAQNNTLAIGHVSGHVSILEFGEAGYIL